MAINNPFSAGGAVDVPELRRAVNSAFTGVVRQANLSLNGKANVATTGTALPSENTLGQLFRLTPANTWHIGNGDGTWTQISA